MKGKWDTPEPSHQSKPTRWKLMTSKQTSCKLIAGCKCTLRVRFLVLCCIKLVPFLLGLCFFSAHPFVIDLVFTVTFIWTLIFGWHFCKRDKSGHFLVQSFTASTRIEARKGLRRVGLRFGSVSTGSFVEGGLTSVGLTQAANVRMMYSPLGLWPCS